ncbi:hypothetical protein [Crocosphaera sp.]|uniref:hypothetical protein n=1 Tax=Crocosphaera sp. TaxID=2729996 RepID=UPI002625DD76|nr:hypothetical protein [Crocosphaera sp.]MDJ0579044.1 hypothetical protein [Crocosphaera sp.]
MLHLSLKRLVARFLKIAQDAIAEVHEWGNCFFVKFVKGSPRFVTKKIRKNNRQKFEEAKEWLNGFGNKTWYVRVWEQHGKKRIYFNLTELLYPMARQEVDETGKKFYFDADKGFAGTGLSLEEFWRCKEFVAWLIP